MNNPKYEAAVKKIEADLASWVISLDHEASEAEMLKKHLELVYSALYEAAQPPNPTDNEKKILAEREATWKKLEEERQAETRRLINHPGRWSY